MLSKPERLTDKVQFRPCKVAARAMSDHRALMGYAIILTLLASNFLRAHFQSITHDEALTYYRYVSQGWEAVLFRFNSNNHTFNTILMKMTISMFGLSHVTMRIAALIGGALYLIAVERICRALFKSRVGYILTLSALTTSPFILDYLVVARGYSLALGFFMIAVLLCVLELRKSEYKENRNREISVWTCCQISCSCALSVASNLSFAFVNTSLLLVFFLFYVLQGIVLVKDKAIWETAWKAPFLKLLLLTIPGGLLFIGINPNIMNFGRGTLYFGQKTWSSAYRSIIDAVLDDLSARSNGSLWLQVFSAMAQVLPLLLGVFILLAGLFAVRKLIRSLKERSALGHRTKLWLFVFSVLLVTVLLHSLGHVIARILLPEERTGIFFVPLLILLVGMSIDDFAGGLTEKTLKCCGWLSFLFLVGCFLSSVHMNYFRNWKYDSGSMGVFLALRSLQENHAGSGVGVYWFFEPSLNFYRTYYKAENIFPRFTREKPNENQSLFVLLPAENDDDKLFIWEHDLTIKYQHPLSNAVVAAKGEIVHSTEKSLTNRRRISMFSQTPSQ